MLVDENLWRCWVTHLAAIRLLLCLNTWQDQDRGLLRPGRSSSIVGENRDPPIVLNDLSILQAFPLEGDLGLDSGVGVVLAQGQLGRALMQEATLFDCVVQPVKGFH